MIHAGIYYPTGSLKARLCVAGRKALYRFDESREGAFYQAIRRYYPALADGVLQPGYTGIRPKIHGPGQPAPDFVIQGVDSHGIAGLVNLFGIESPGLTASPAIADHVAAMLDPH